MASDHQTLSLGLGFTSKPDTPPKSNLPKQQVKISVADPEPSLTLSLGNRSEEPPPPASGGELYTSASPLCSAASSLSNTTVKRERDQVASDEDDDVTATNTGTRKKLRLTKEQSALLEESFKQQSTLNPKQKKALADRLSLRPRQIEVWFQNRRARTKLKQTEVDCEYLKKFCETLTDENRRLQKELQELKAVNRSHPFYMHLPAATLTMCPSCERIGAGAGSAGVSGGGTGGSKSAFAVSSKPYFFNSFTNPSAAC